MKMRLLCLGLVAVVTQLFGTGCYCFHPVERWRANHPCGACANPHYHPLLHPILTRRAYMNDGFGPAPAPGSITGPVVGGGPVTVPACHGCGDPGIPVSMSGSPGPIIPLVPGTAPPTIGSPMPLNSGPTVVPSYELPKPMPLPGTGGH